MVENLIKEAEQLQKDLANGMVSPNKPFMKVTYRTGEEKIFNVYHWAYFAKGILTNLKVKCEKV